MHKKSKLLMAIAGAGLIGALTGCSSQEAQVAPSVPLENAAPSTSQQTSSSSVQDRMDLIKPIEDVQNEIANISKENNTAGSIPADGSENDTTNYKGNGSTEPTPDNDSTVELIALADTEEQAKAIADMYGITLKSFSYGVAVYTTNKDPHTVIQSGIDNGYPTLSLNHKLQYY